MLITPALTGSACRSGVLPGWIGLECARRAGGLPLRPGLGLVEPSHGPWRTEAGVAFKSLHCHFSTPPTGRRLHAHRVVFVWSVLWVLCAHGGSSFFQGLTDHCAVGPAQCNFGLISEPHRQCQLPRGNCALPRRLLKADRSSATAGAHLRELPHGHRAVVYSPTAAEASTIPSGYRCQCGASLLARRPLLRQTASDLVHVAGVPWRTWLW